MINSKQIQNNWPTIKLHVLSRWNKLSEAEVEKTHGNTQSLSKLVHHKYGSKEEFDKTFEKICNSCIPSSRNNEASHKIIPDETTSGYKATPMATVVQYFHSGDPERSLNANFYQVENDEVSVKREADDELSAYRPNHHAFNEFEDNIQFDTHYTNSIPDDISYIQHPCNSEDITLGREYSSATNRPTAYAAQKSSDIPSNDATKKRV